MVQHLLKIGVKGERRKALDCKNRAWCFFFLFEMRKSEGPFGTGYLGLSVFLGEEKGECCTRALEIGGEKDRREREGGRAFNRGQCFFQTLQRD